MWWESEGWMQEHKRDVTVHSKLVCHHCTHLYNGSVALDLCCMVALECNTFGKLDSQVWSWFRSSIRGSFRSSVRRSITLLIHKLVTGPAQLSLERTRRTATTTGCEYKWRTRWPLKLSSQLAQARFKAQFTGLKLESKFKLQAWSSISSSFRFVARFIAGPAYIALFARTSNTLPLYMQYSPATSLLHIVVKFELGRANYESSRGMGTGGPGLPQYFLPSGIY